MRSGKLAALGAVAALLFAQGCSASTSSPTLDVVPNAGAAEGAPASSGPLGKYIKHVVIIVQENRSFNNFFHGYPGAVSQNEGKTLTGRTVKLHEIGFSHKDLLHTWQFALTDWDNGKMDGYSANEVQLPSGAVVPSKLFAYSYVNKDMLRPYWTMAREYVLGDRMFATMFGNSYTGHLDLIAGTANLKPDLSVIDHPSGSPWGCDGPTGSYVNTVDQTKTVTKSRPFPCFTQFATMADVLDAKKVSWEYYEPASNKLWDAFDSISKVRYGPDWAAHVGHSQTQVLADAASGSLPAMSWVIPDFADSDHPASGKDYGPSWVAAVVNAIGHGPDWKSTAIFIVWDDWGGWYDGVAPPQLSFTGLGERVPVIVVSPYAKQGYVSHTQYEFGSMLKFSEETFGLSRIGVPSFGYTDTRANDMLDAFDFTQAPRRFTTIPAKYPPSFFLDEQPSGEPTDTE